jgi:hypothetical protein
MIACGNTKKATEIINNPKFTVNQALIINTGVNDVEHLKPVKIIEDQVHLVEAASHMFPGRKIILSDITPRTDNLDQAIIKITYNKETYRLAFKQCLTFKETYRLCLSFSNSPEEVRL